MWGTKDTVAGVNRRLLYPIIILISLENHEAYRLFRELSNRPELPEQQHNVLSEVGVTFGWQRLTN